MNKKRLLSIALMVVMFLTVSLVGIDASRLKGTNYSNKKIALAASKGKLGGFKSGSFKFSGFKSGGFKSGSFFNTKKSNPFSSSNSWSTNRTRRSFSFIPIPWNFGYHGGSLILGLLFGSLRAIIRLIIIIIVICIIVRYLRRRRY